jgi:tetratricopeptide (TPR) repeat protein
LELQQRNTREDAVKAVEYLKKAIELDPDFARAQAQLAAAYHLIITRRWDVDLDWTDARSLRRKHLQIAMENPTPLALRTSARFRLYRRQYEEAIAETERAIALDPNDADNYWSMGYVLTYAGRSAEAVDPFKMAMRLNPHYPGWYPYFLGVAQYCLEQYEEAATSQERGLRVSPSSSTWWLAAAYAQLGREEEAADALTKYIEKRGWILPHVENTFRYQPFKNQRDLDRFGEGLVKAGLPRPWNPVFRRQYEEAISEAQSAIAVNPDSAEAQYTMGETLVFVGRPAEAIEFLKRAMELNPKYPANYLWTLGLAQFSLEHYEDAAISFEKYYEIAKKIGTPKWILAATYAHLGRQQKAEDVLAKYIKERGYKGYTVERVLKIHLHALKEPKDKARFAEGLHKAGLPMK